MNISAWMRGCVGCRFAAILLSGLFIPCFSVHGHDEGEAVREMLDPLVASQMNVLFPQVLAPWANPRNLQLADLSRVPPDQLYGFVSDIIEPDVFGRLRPEHRRMLATIAENTRRGGPKVGLCFTPGMEPKAIEAFETALWGPPGLNYRAANRWSTAATSQPGPLTQGQPTTLTYSFVPDGTHIPSGSGEPAGPSDLFAVFNGIYGSAAAWQAHFASVFARWEQLTGLDFVLEANDDAAQLGNLSPGLLGVRGDIRIGGHFIDGQSGANTLAYNYYPNTGDMVIDTTNVAFYSNMANSARALRNVVAHENGHGLGMAHVCPMNATKLMEPFISTAYDGPQHDDIQLGNRHYGDPYERVAPNNNNDSAPAAWNLGVLGNGTTQLEYGSIDDDTDMDYYVFTLPAMKDIQISVEPIGLTYLEGPQNGDGTCPAGTNLNSLNVQNLAFRLFDTDGATILYNVNSHPPGNTETLGPVTPPLAQAGSYYIQVLPISVVNNVQLYRLSVTITDHVNATKDAPVFD